MIYIYLTLKIIIDIILTRPLKNHLVMRVLLHNGAMRPMITDVEITNGTQTYL